MGTRGGASWKTTTSKLVWTQHLLCLTYLRVRSENINNWSVVLLLMKRLKIHVRCSLIRLDNRPSSRLVLIITSWCGYASCLWVLTGLPDSVALLCTGGRTRSGLAPMITRTPLHLFSANPGGAAELMSQRARGYLCSGVLKRQATSR